MFAAIDLGSNSFRMHIGTHDGEAMRIVKTSRDQIRLAGGLDANGNLTESAISAALTSLAGFGQTMRNYPLTAARVVGTNTLRVAKNTAQLLPLAEKAIGYPIEIISGEEEGRLIYMGVANTLATEQERRLVIDIGGGSTELIVGCGLDIEYVESFSIGTFKQGPTFFPNGDITEEGFDAAILSARSNFQDHPAAFDPKNWQNAYGSSGTIRSIAEIIAKNEIGSGLLNKKSMLALKQRFIASGNMSKISFPGLRPDRVSAVVGGLAVLIGLCDELGIALVNPIEAGLRMGVLWDLYLRSTQRDRREISVRSFLHKFNADQARAQRVADDAAFLFTKLKPVADDDMQKHLEWAALLHEVGMNVSHTNYHKHSSYIVENADLPGFTNAEQKLMGRLILGQKGNLRKIGDLHETPDFLKALLALRISVIFLHSRLEVNFEQLRIRVKSKIELEFANNWLQAHPTASYWLEKEREWWGQVGIEFVIKSAV